MKNIITANGTYPINGSHNDSRSAIYISGALGTATAKFVYEKADGTSGDVIDGAILIGDQIKMEHGVGVSISILVTGANGSTAIDVVCGGID